MSIDIEAIRSRIAKAGAFSIPRWVANDMTALLTEVGRLGEETPPVVDDAERKKLHSRIWVLERDLARAKQALEAERQRADKSEAEAEVERARAIAYLRYYASYTPPGAISPVRKAAQAFAHRTAEFFERGEHRIIAVGAS